nr:uncharacterized protein LOC128702585 [Cherax quadricarinatus]
MSQPPRCPPPSMSTTSNQSMSLTRTRSYPRASSSWDMHRTPNTAWDPNRTPSTRNTPSGQGPSTGPGPGTNRDSGTAPKPAIGTNWDSGSVSSAPVGTWDPQGKSQGLRGGLGSQLKGVVISSAPRGRFAPPIGSKCVTLGRSSSFVLRPLTRYLTQGVLVQEVDEGQPCLMCRDKCPGYTSHVWR